MPYKPHPEARDTLLDLFKRKWGEPKDASTTARLLVFHDEDPRVEVREDTEHGAWQIEIKLASVADRQASMP